MLSAFAVGVVAVVVVDYQLCACLCHCSGRNPQMAALKAVVLAVVGNEVQPYRLLLAIAFSR
jgi:hypothetical protein